ncbi:MAG: iron ABC transporter permease [Streptococcus sp.]|jgi:iron complex transport system permease protein|uniref:Iron ABC transporter permease n=1 Tax=Streptococcus parasuis TaxID=1501662 RepID=A0A4Q8L199_9STRE|nr:iron ABC transporter permease [Streptococcus parasuis]MBP8703836.1 iron ABC transporter permease [Streptococcus sp.]MBP9623302.1 iron ABC transporter permease [Streptococcus sp.]TAA12763.1 iron ABC transporter permease [Streptococcus parasuis]
MNRVIRSHSSRRGTGYLVQPLLIFFIISLLFVIGAYLSLRFGAISYSHQQLVETLRHPMTDSPVQDVVIDLRLPRMVAAILVGAAMAQAGAMMQGITRNVIADPGLLGINAGAGLALILGYAIFGSLHYSQILVICLLGSCLAAGLVFGLSYQVQKGYNQLRLILSGAMVASLFSAIGQAITIYFDLSTAVIGWQAGGLVQVNWEMLAIIGPLIIVGLILAQLFSHQLTILSLNETVAKNLGQRTALMTMVLLGIVLLLSAAAVALVGSLSFVGLIIPHFIRMFTGKNYKMLLPLTAFAGASFLIWVDLVCRSINPPAETPISAVISIIGLPCFLWLIRKEKHL